eukprot:CAMPEP_0170320346 /NCGR_PEP_ID=MMETSP0116_2-20130129/60904_1 /TAXON_ID=400756 /ORGANISM="Durinskia baltica, Strain CSIRO CS-38" /LENGTH=39 /DNA_ID= /DNA_START= /DNA_END= /DNA_ORIENTATION=
MTPLVTTGNTSGSPAAYGPTTSTFGSACSNWPNNPSVGT